MWKAGAQQFQFNSYEPGNLLDIALKRWTPENPDSNYPSMRLNKYQNEVVGFAVYDASYWKNPKHKFRLSRTGILAQAYQCIQQYDTFFLDE